MQHASQAFPSHWVVLLDLLLTAAALIAALAAPRWSLALDRRLWPRLRRWGRRPVTAALGLGLAGVLGLALIFLVQGPPIPQATDERSYLLAADTFARGRLANPPSPAWRHLDAHALQRPVYAAKYPPAQGLFLAAGQVLTGTPAASLCLAAGLLAAAALWVLRAWLPPSWALLGALLVLLRLGVGSYWNQSYWGGTVAAIGGALVYGALPRLLRSGAVGHAMLFALGLVVLANSRPYEGLLASLPALLVFGWALATSPRRGVLWRRAAAPIAIVLAVAALAMLAYNQRLTGNPLCLPHRAYAAAHDAPPEFFFQAYEGPYVDYQTRPAICATSLGLAPPRAWLGRVAAAAPDRLARMLFFVLGLGLTLSLAATLAPRAGDTPAGVTRRPPWRALLAACVLVAAGQALTRPWFPHYPSPIAIPLFVFAVAGLRRLRGRRWRGRRFGRSLPLAILAINLALFVFQLPAHRPDDDHWTARRERIETFLETRPGRHLVIVDGHGDWVSNGADLESERVVWVRDPDAAPAGELIRYFPGRHVWWLDALAPEPWPVPWADRPPPSDRRRRPPS